ncbi:terminal hydrolase 4 [Seminavis robusta]|uniref:Terminal hydrolase 4 n=1 Tax=Seminavis robusta TaxID=568900 RepID=A0A9N8H444_9STRA|nr:terminal hydrolase 4 [Seminavis robusta]|eukprot:Sro104_g052810.1 terminal hydrolase 4 (1303) ;mRNA; f:49829-54102
MVALSSSYSDDVLRMATAFRQARDEDTRQVLNAMAAKKTPSSLSDLTFYMVPSSWMMKAWPMLDAVAADNGSSGVDDDGKWRESVGPVQTIELLSCDHTVSSDEEGGGTVNGNCNKPTNGGSTQQQSSNSVSLKRDLKHGVDFFLLGPNAWLLVKAKFGSDKEIVKPCVFHQTEESMIAVAIDSSSQNGGSSSTGAGHQNLVPVPPGGYFPYKKLLEELEGDSDETFLPQPSRAQGPQQQPQHHAAETTQTTVSDDEGGDNDLFPEPDAMVVSSDSNGAQHEESQGPILLPPSTTASPANSNNNDSLYPNVQDMECGDNTESKEDPADNQEDSNVASARVVPAVAASTYKKYGSGLGNLGNTCFMNSTLQCLAHTDPLRRYFLSGDYENDLNRDNPLGTGGDLATEFAQLLAEMWGTTPPGGRKIETSSYVSSSSTVYPRSFKFTLGKHAEQFMGYDQHDSQELATYLLDALHEDTNRVTKKPYVEKPEQGEDEADDVAARKAWDLHLKREDSRVLENFMGQVKSRVKCCKEGCGRVSTTFDPFMYLSVPIPGATDRTMRVTFVPLDGNIRKKELSVTLNRNSSVSKLVMKTAEQLMKAGYSSNGKPFSLDELCACDIWTKEVYQWYDIDSDEIDKIRETDETYIYQVQAKADLRKLDDDASVDDEARISEALEKYPYRPQRYKVDPGTMRNLHDEGWKTSLEGYTRMQALQLTRVLNPRRGSTSERFDLFQKLDTFIVSCIKESDKASNKRAREEEGDEESPPSPQEQSISADSECIMVKPEEEEVPALVERSEKSETFKAVKSRFDLAVLEHCAAKLRRMIGENSGKSKKKKEDGIYVQIYQRKSASVMSGASFTEKGFVNPLVLRIPVTMTVYGLREELAKRLARCLKIPINADSASQPTKDEAEMYPESDVIPMEGDSDRGDNDQLSGDDAMNMSSDSQSNVGDPALLIMRRIPLSYYRKKNTYGQSKSWKKLGSLEAEQSSDGRPISLAAPTHADEQELVSEWVGDKGTLCLEWPADLCEQAFDANEYEGSDEVKDPEEEEALAARNRKANHPITILDCVEKYCAEEQLEETEMWYCNRCKEHVRAWKQFHIYLAPPILIMHLKRFQYSASTHRRDKIGTYIDFPLTGLDLSKHVLHCNEGEEPIYDCYAVSNHYGGLGGGHYTAYALHDDGAWCYYDDSRISEDVPEKDVVSDAAYVVYYRRRDVPKDNFPEGLETPAIITDHVDKVHAPSDEASSTNAAADMDVDDIHAGDADSRGSSRTFSSSTNAAVDMYVDDIHAGDADSRASSRTDPFLRQ